MIARRIKTGLNKKDQQRQIVRINTGLTETNSDDQDSLSQGSTEIHSEDQDR
jgi:hypothetical protein